MLLVDELDARLERTLVTCPAKFLEHFDVRRLLGVVADATAVTTTVVAAASGLAYEHLLADALDTSESIELVDEY